MDKSETSVFTLETIPTSLEERLHARATEFVLPHWLRKKISPNLEGSETSKEAKANWIELASRNTPSFEIGSIVSNFCKSTDRARAFVFFSLDNPTVHKLLDLLVEESSVEISYLKGLALSEVGTHNLIELCYGEKPFFSEKFRKRMARERFTFSNRAVLVVYKLKRPDVDIRKLKSDLRTLLPGLTFERRIHGTDGPSDTRILVEALANPNTVSLLNYAEVSRHDRIFTRIPEALRDNPQICLDGSAVMELFGLRKSRDADFICAGEKLRSEILSLGFDVNNDHYKWLPVGASEIIENPRLHVPIFGMKFTSLAVRQLVLQIQAVDQGGLNAKKSRDLELINQFGKGNNRKRRSYPSVLGTLSTQSRLLFEFFVSKIVPKLPQPIAKGLRAIRAFLLSR